jgi:hypothetical protein
MNPTGQPGFGTPMPSAPSGAARDAVNLPSIFIMILGALGIAMFLAAIISEVGGGSSRLLEWELARMPPDLRERMEPLLAMNRSGSKVGGIMMSLIGVAISAFTVFGGLQMRALKNWGVALASAIIVMTPCSTYCCCCLGIPIGIWALIMLTKPEVKSAFS